MTNNCPDYGLCNYKICPEDYNQCPHYGNRVEEVRDVSALEIEPPKELEKVSLEGRMGDLSDY